ncbi:uncharacterized protein LOC134299652 [Anolis carolinensis]|uniref:uncharacterized protein LOC134299652 n=1 Tax=Anolis carolinensis TaxID=28377 RepID=UPI000203948D
MRWHTAITQVLLFGFGWLLTVEAQKQEKPSEEIEIIERRVEPDGSTSSHKIFDSTFTAPAATASSTTTKSFLERLAVLFSTMATEIQPSLLTVPPASTTMAETLPMKKITAKQPFFELLIASIAQSFTSTMTTTIPQSSTKIHPVALPSVVVHTSSEPSAKLYPAMGTSPMVSAELHTTTASVLKIPDMASAPATTLELLIPTEAGPEIPASPQHLTASEGQSAEETSPELTTTVTEAIVAEFSVPMAAAKCKIDIPLISKVFKEKLGGALGLIALEQFMENMGNLVADSEIAHKKKLEIMFSEIERALKLASLQKRSKCSLKIKSRLQKLWSRL